MLKLWIDQAVTRNKSTRPTNALHVVRIENLHPNNSIEEFLRILRVHPKLKSVRIIQNFYLNIWVYKTDGRTDKQMGVTFTVFAGKVPDASTRVFKESLLARPAVLARIRCTLRCVLNYKEITQIKH